MYLYMADSPHDHPTMTQNPFTSFPPPLQPPPPPQTTTVNAHHQSPHSQSTTTVTNITTLTTSPKKIKKTVSSGGSQSRPPAAATGKHPTYRGIRSRTGKWVSEIREPRKTTRIWLGTYPSPEMAAAAYDVAALALRGGDVLLNFPDHVRSYPVPSSTSPQDIRRAAANAAELMRPGSGGGVVAGDPPTNDEAAAAASSSGHDEFVDEEALFHMPNLLKYMAEGMLVNLPRMSEESPEYSDGECLWSYLSPTS